MFGRKKRIIEVLYRRLDDLRKQYGAANQRIGHILEENSRLAHEVARLRRANKALTIDVNKPTAKPRYHAIEKARQAGAHG